MKKLYIGNLPFSATEDQLHEWFSQVGVTPSGVNLIRDRFTGQSRGFAFVEVNADEDADRAINSLNGQNFGGRNLVVNEARPQRPWQSLVSKHSESECAAPQRGRGASLLLRESCKLSLRQSAIPAILTSGCCNRPTKLESGQRSRGARRKSTSRWPTYANVCSSVYYLRRALSETIRPVTCLKQ